MIELTKTSMKDGVKLVTDLMKLQQNRVKTEYSFVIPAYKEEKNVPIIYEKITKLMKSISSDYEIIFVDDNSSDKTLEVIKSYSKDKRVKYLSFSRNFGHQAAITAGMDASSGKAIITMDCDLQDPPEVITEMIKKWKSGNDVVYARRKNRKDNFFKKYTAIAYYKLLDKFSDLKIPRNVGDFRLVDRKVLTELNGMKEKSRYIRGMVAWLGFKCAFVDFNRPERIHGETNYTLRKMMKLAMDGILNFSLLPLRLGLWVGLLSIFVSMIFLAYMTFDAIFNATEYPLYKWMILMIAIMLGFMFMLIWILGEYVGRIYEESKNRPLYVIREQGL